MDIVHVGDITSHPVTKPPNATKKIHIALPDITRTSRIFEDPAVYIPHVNSVKTHA